MRKVLFLIPVLFAYVLVLGHNLIPHVHEDHTTHSNHGHSAPAHEHSDHDHDHGHDKESDDHEESNPGGLNHFLAHFAHSPYTASSISISVVAAQKDGTADQDVPVFIPETLFLFECHGQVPFRPPVKDDRLPSGNSPSALSLRGPPVVA